MNCCGKEMFAGVDGDVAVATCTGECRQQIRLVCPNEGTPLQVCIEGDSYMCTTCGQEWYWREGRLMRGSEALRAANGNKL